MERSLADAALRACGDVHVVQTGGAKDVDVLAVTAPRQRGQIFLQVGYPGRLAFSTSTEARTTPPIGADESVITAMASTHLC